MSILHQIGGSLWLLCGAIVIAIQYCSLVLFSGISVTVSIFSAQFCLVVIICADFAVAMELLSWVATCDYCVGL